MHHGGEWRIAERGGDSLDCKRQCVDSVQREPEQRRDERCQSEWNSGEQCPGINLSDSRHERDERVTEREFVPAGRYH